MSMRLDRSRQQHEKRPFFTRLIRAPRFRVPRIDEIIPLVDVQHGALILSRPGEGHSPAMR